MDRTYASVQAALDPTTREAETMGAALAAARSVRPDAPYLTFAETGETYTVAEVDDWATRVAGGLADLGVSKGDRVGLYLRNSPAFVASVYACAKLGAVQVPINPDYREREVRHAFDTAGPVACLVGPDTDHHQNLAAVEGEFDTFEHCVLVEDAVSEPVDEPEPLVDCALSVHRFADLDGPVPDVDVGPEDPFTIIYTSGTTGLPKPALLPHRSYLLSGKSFLPALPEKDVNYNPFPLFHGNNQYYSMVGPLLAGTEWLLGRKFTASKFHEYVERYGVTSFNILGGTPKLLLSTYDSFPETSLEVAIGPIGTETWDRFADRFSLRVLQIYSQTESPTLLMNHPEPEKVRKGAIGKPMFPDLSHEVTVLDRDENPVPAGEEGELTRTDPGAMLEYFRMPEKTEETLREGRIFSGDVVRADEDGYLYYVDRVKFMIRRSGENIAPREVEEVVDELEGVAESAVIPVPDDIRGEEVKAMVRRTGVHGVTERDVVRQVARTLAAHKVPRYVEFVDSFPKTPSERIQRVQLAEQEKEHDDYGWDRDREFPDWADEV
jgi:crotonobetaine/carnitine-CoA ligase